MDRLGVFVVEDSEVVRGHLQSMLADIPGVELVGYAVEEQEAIERISQLLPDVVTLDLHLKDGTGMAVLEHLRNKHPTTRVIVLTNFVDRFYINKCISNGADFVFDKTSQFSRVNAVLWMWIFASSTDSHAVSPIGEN